MSKTIVAIATPLGAGAIGVVRLSGPAALEIANQVFCTKKLDSFALATPNQMYLGKITCDGFCDKCLAVYFKAPFSFTGEDVVEFQCHGGVRLLEEVVKTLLSHGATMADKGEFTKQAFLNGKLDLSEAEGIVDMINSENIASLNAGYRMMSGKLHKAVDEINENILNVCAELEASLDYPEEMEDEVRSALPKQMSKLKNNIKNLLDTAKLGRIVKNGINVAIIGKPNIGKSSLLNAILGKDRAIVTDIAGTTRDTLEERVERRGIFINFIDTAGIRDTSDTIEQIGVDKAFSSATSADVVLFMLNANQEPTAEELEILKKFADKPVIKVFNKADLGRHENNKNGIFISAKHGENVESILNEICDLFLQGGVDTSGDVITNLRHIEALKNAYNCICSAEASCKTAPTECVLVDLKDCYLRLGAITGSAVSENIIDAIFSKFCLGK